MSEIVDWLADTDEQMLLMPGYDDALIGWVEQIGRPPIALYDIEKLMDIMMNKEGMTEEEAWEHYHYNIVGGWVGEYTPAFAYLYQNNKG